jgi:hypothetical protein
MHPNALRFCIFWMLLPAIAAAQAPIARVYVDDADGRVHIVTRAGKDTLIPKEKDQVRGDSPKVAEDQQTAGWLIDYENCCTSYPIPLTLVICRFGRIVQRIQPGLMIFDWRFVEGARKIALSSGTVHGMTFRSLSLYDVRTGRRLDQWEGSFEEAPPLWARGLSQ